MNAHKQYALQHMGMVQPDKNYFLFHPNNSCTSHKQKQNRVYTYLLQKFVMLQKHEYLGDIIMQLLKHLNGQYFFPNYQGNHELRDFLIYYNLLVLQNNQVYKLFYNVESSYKYKFKLWLRSLCHLDDKKLQIEVEKFQFDTEYLNTFEYQVLMAIINESDIELSNVNNGFVLLKLINYKEDEEKLSILKHKKNTYINDSYILKKEWFMLSIRLDKPLELAELNQLCTVDNYDPVFQSLLISKFMNIEQYDKAIEQIFEHLYLTEGNSTIWNLLQQMLTPQMILKYQDEFLLLIRMHFGQRFLRSLLIYPLTLEQQLLIECKLNVLSHLDKEQSEKLQNFLKLHGEGQII